MISPVATSTKAPSVGTGLNAKTPPISPVIIAVAPVQLGVYVNEASSEEKTVMVSLVVSRHGPTVVYSTVYIVPGTPITEPVATSIVAPSEGTGLKAKAPPTLPVITAVAPVQVAVNVKPASSNSKTVTDSLVIDGHEPATK